VSYPPRRMEHTYNNMSCYTTESEAREAGEIVYRAHNGLQAWCLCPDCTTRHASENKRRTRHDRWAIDGHDYGRQISQA
jgi:hypothetical protein